MDVFFHLIIGMIISNIFLGKILLIVVIAAVLPDLIGTTYFYILLLKNSSKKSFKAFFKDYMNHINTRTFFGKLDMALYRVTHSLFGWLFFTGLCFIFYKESYLVISLAYLSHLIIDPLVHKKDYATRLFYPFSDFHIKGDDWNHNVKRYLLVDLIALMVFFIIFFY